MQPHLVATANSRSRSSEEAAEEFLAGGVAVGGVDEGDPQVQEAVEEALYLLEGRPIADTSRSESMAADLEGR